MSVHLVGGGWTTEHAPAVYGPFAEEVTAHASAAGRQSARVGMVLVLETVGDVSEKVGQLTRALEAAGASLDVETVVAPEGGELDPSWPGDLDGLVVGGGLTPAYASALSPATALIRELVAAGVPYLGFSAGAAVAADRAIVGGWLQGAVPICSPDNGEDLEQLTVVDGLGLVPFAVDVHAAQWGNLTRLVIAVRDGLAPRGVAVDEDTCLVVSGERESRAGTVYGAGQVWVARPSPDGVVLQVLSAGSTLPLA